VTEGKVGLLIPKEDLKSIVEVTETKVDEACPTRSARVVPGSS
jgi:hypothetical protein